MKKIIVFIILVVLVLTIGVVAEKTKPQKIEDLEKIEINNKDQDELLNHYGKKFKDVIGFNNYKNDKNIIVLNVTMRDGSYARILTTNSTFTELLK